MSAEITREHLILAGALIVLYLVGYIEDRTGGIQPYIYLHENSIKVGGTRHVIRCASACGMSLAEMNAALERVRVAAKNGELPTRLLSTAYAEVLRMVDLPEHHYIVATMCSELRAETQVKKEESNGQ